MERVLLVGPMAPATYFLFPKKHMEIIGKETESMGHFNYHYP
jgi:hypothetical protein